MIIIFPSICHGFEVRQALAKGERFYIAHYIMNNQFVTAPIHLKQNDRILVDLREMRVDIVEREGIAIYRSGWLN